MGEDDGLGVWKASSEWVRPQAQAADSACPIPSPRPHHPQCYRQSSRTYANHSWMLSWPISALPFSTIPCTAHSFQP